MAQFVRQGLVEVVVVEQVVFLADAEDPAVKNDAVIESTHGREVGKSQGRHAAVQAGDHPDVHVVFNGPVAERLEVVFRGGVQVVLRDEAVLGVLGNGRGGVHPHDARRRIALGVAAGQFELDVDVHTTELSPEVGIEGVDGALDLGVRQVVLHTDGFAMVQDMNHNGQRVFRARAEGSGGHLPHRGLDGEEAPGIGGIRLEVGLKDGFRGAPVTLRREAGKRGHKEQEEQGGGKADRRGHGDGDLVPLLQASSSGCIFLR